MRVFALWYGGYNYSHGYISDHLEEFPSLSAAKEAFRERFYTNSFMPHTFRYVSGHEELAAPNTDASCSMTIWRYDPRGVMDPYPDVMLTIGPRGGVQASPC